LLVVETGRLPVRWQRLSWWVQILGVNVPGNFFDYGQRRLKGEFGGLGDFLVQRLLQRGDFFGGQDALAQQSRPHLDERIAQGVGLALGLGAIELVVVGEGVGVRPHAMAMHKGRPLAGAAVCHGGLKGQEAGLRIGTVHLGKIEVGKLATRREILPPAYSPRPAY